MSIAEQLTTIAENVPKVYEAGKKSEYDKFWDAFQNNGNKTNYYVAFYGPSWNNDNFKPKYLIKPSSLNSAFASCGISGDLTGLCELDTSNCTNFSSAFNGCTGITRVGVIDCRKASGNVQPFKGCTALETIDKIILKSDGTHGLTTLTDCTSLMNITIEGVQGVSCDVSSCPLIYDSIMSIINALKDYSGSGTTYTLTLGTTNLAKLTDAEKAIATEKGWTLA